MAAERPLLVVDDEEVVCQACQRIFSRQGFKVDVSTDARRGLAMATEKDYDIVLLDIKMPNMDGIEFLEKLREKKPDVPVLIITGYPSIPNASAAMRLGACDYVTKPFTTEEITWAVRRVLSMKEMLSGEGGPAATVVEAEVAPKPPVFWDEVWARVEVDGSACVGAVLPGLRGVQPTEVRLPRIGEVVYQGLPLAGVLTAGGKTPIIVPSPVSGVVMEVNQAVTQKPSLLLTDPCGEGWIACVCTTRHEEEGNCKPRRLILVNADQTSAAEQSRKLTCLGCDVEPAADRESLERALARDGERPVFFDAASLGGLGPSLVEIVNRRAPQSRVVVFGAAGGTSESDYRKYKIFYYAVEPFADNEIADILAAVFRMHEVEPGGVPGKKTPPEPISAITITNRNLHKVQLLSGPGLLWGNEGLGALLSKKLLAKMFPVFITPGESHLTPANILKAAAACDRVMVLLARDCGLLPGSLARDTKPEFEIDPGEAAGKITVLTVQPDALGGFALLDGRTIAALAEHIVWDMASY